MACCSVSSWFIMTSDADVDEWSISTFSDIASGIAMAIVVLLLASNAGERKREVR